MNESIQIFCDGGSRGNPGQAAYGFVIYTPEHKIVHKEGNKLGIQTNNFAEYTAVIRALEWVYEKHNTKPQTIQFFLDSKLAVEQLSGNWKIKSETIRPLFVKVKNLERLLSSKISYTHVPRTQNTEADKMVNTALDTS